MHFSRTIRSLINLYLLIKRERKLTELIVWARRKRLKEQVGWHREEQAKIDFLLSKLTPIQRVLVELIHLWCIALAQLTARAHKRYRKQMR
jgi:hypothetical protein